MSRNVCLVLCILVVQGASPVVAQPPLLKIEATDHETVSATITYETLARNCIVSRWTAFLPEPPELPSQTGVKTTSTPTGKVVAEKSPLARNVRMIDLQIAKPAPGAEFKVRLEIRATLRSRELVPLAKGESPPTVTSLTPTEKKYYLAPSNLVDFDAKPFRDWLEAKKLRLQKNEQPLTLAARVLEELRDDFKYRYDELEDKRASAVCTRAGTDCGGMTNLFVAVMRANEIPARALIGRLALPRKPGAMPTDLEFDRPHARAEMYVEGVGWVPVDPSYAVATKENPVTAFIGHDPGDLLVLHVDFDLRLPFPDKERTADLLQLGPYYWVAGRGAFESVPGPNGWEVTTAPVVK